MASASFKYNWSPLERNYQQERQVLDNKIKLQPAPQHPLHPKISTVAAASLINESKPKSAATPSIAVSTPLDPLSIPSSAPTPTSINDDPLSGTLSTASNNSSSAIEDPLQTNLYNDPLRRGMSVIATTNPLGKKLQLTAQLNRASSSRKGKNTFLNWSAKKVVYLKKFTTEKNIPVISKIMEDDDEKIYSLEEKLAMRLEQLEQENKESNISYMNQKEYIKMVEDYNEELKQAWNLNDRVKCIKIVIRSCKLLCQQTQVPAFYPSMFVLVAEVLDTFGSLVFNRIKEKSSYKDFASGRTIKLPTKFSSMDVTEDAKEVCRNWFYKIASIRELGPRLFCEMALIANHKFLSDDRSILKREIDRMGRMIRGLGNPLVAAFGRLYLARKGVELIPEEKSYLIQMLDDILLSLDKQCTGEAFEKTLTQLNITKFQYLELFEPPLEWLLEAIGNVASETLFQKMLQKYESQETKSSVLLKCLVSGFDSDVISEKASLLVYLIKQNEDETVPKYLLYKALGEKFCLSPPAANEQLKLLNEIWKDVAQMTDVVEYVRVTEVYVEYVAKNFSLREVAILLRDLKKHLHKFEGIDKIEEELSHILLNILEYAEDFVEVFNMEHFLPIFDLLKPITQAEVSKGMLTALSKRDKPIQADPVIINSLLDLARSVHDSVHELSAEDEKQKISQLLSNFINKISFGTAFEKQMNFYVDCRRTFSRFDSVKEALVLSVLGMVQKTYVIVKGKHSKKTSAFIKACLAFCHITIPSIDDLLKRLYLYVLTGQVAIVNNLLSQADVLFKTAIETVANVPTLLILDDNTTISTEQSLVQYIIYMMNSLIAMPGHPEFGPFYLLKQLVQTISEYKWSNGSDCKVVLLIQVLSCLAAYDQDDLPFHYMGMSASNDELFFGDKTYHDSIVSIGNQVLEEILKDMALLANDADIGAQRKQAQCALELLNHLLCFCELHTSALLALCYNLFQLVGKYLTTNTAVNAQHTALKLYWQHTAKYLERRIKYYMEEQAKKKRVVENSQNPYYQLYQKVQPLLNI